MRGILGMGVDEKKDREESDLDSDPDFDPDFDPFDSGSWLRG